MSFLKLQRKLFNHQLWTEERSFSRFEAWLDLLQSAAWKDQEEVVKGELVKVPRGSLIASERYLSERWRWGRQKVRTFLNTLENEEMIMKIITQPITQQITQPITQQITQPQKGQITLISLRKYEEFNPAQNLQITQQITQPITQQITQGITQREEKERSKECVLAPLEKEEAKARAVQFGTTEEVAEEIWIYLDSMNWRTDEGRGIQVTARNLASIFTRYANSRKRFAKPVAKAAGKVSAAKEGWQIEKDIKQLEGELRSLRDSETSYRWVQPEEPHLPRKKVMKDSAKKSVANVKKQIASYRKALVSL